MQQLIFLIFILLSGSYCLHSQTISGMVCDSITKAPVVDAYVYLDGTSIHTTTNTSGKFDLLVGKTMNTRLIISHVAYETVSILKPFEKMPDTLYLEVKTNSLDEVVITADRFSREQKLKVFREQFLGKNQAGKSCHILNEDNIQIFYNAQTKTLLASSDEPIVIENKYLGYQLTFVLKDFSIRYTEYTLHSDKIKQSVYLGTSLFTDLNPQDPKIKKRREETYKSSPECFFKNLANNTLEESQFRIFNNISFSGADSTDYYEGTSGLLYASVPIDQKLYFAIKDTLPMKMVHILPFTDIDKGSSDFGKPVFGIISILYKSKEKSMAAFFTGSFLVDQYGNIDAIDQVMFGGVMGASRIGNMLPLDYEPIDSAHLGQTRK